MFGYLAGFVGLLVGLVLPFGEPAVASMHDGPRLAYVREGEPLQGEELLTVDPSGEYWQSLLRSPNSGHGITAVSWSGDGSRLAFGTMDGVGLLSPPRRPAVFVLPADGGSPRAVRGTERAFSPVLSPDGSTIAFARFRLKIGAGRRLGKDWYVSASVWLVDARGGTPWRVTPWRDRLLIVPWSFSPDGTKLAAVRATVRGGGSSIISVSIPSGERSLLVEKGMEPTYSPDGSRITFSREWRTGRLTRLGHRPALGGDLFVAASDGSWTRRLTFSPMRREAGPNWDPSGERIAFTRYPARLTWQAQEGIGSSIVEINADGTCEHRILFTYGLTYRNAVWRPGAGRGAGRIEC